MRLVGRRAASTWKADALIGRLPVVSGPRTARHEPAPRSAVSARGSTGLHTSSVPGLEAWVEPRDNTLMGAHGVSRIGVLGRASRRRARVAPCIFLLVLLASAVFAGQEAPLPDKDDFLAKARQRLKSDDRLLEDYAYRERQVRVDFDTSGHVTSKVTKEFEVYPSVDGSPAYRRLVAVNGVPEPAGKLADADRRQRAKTQEWLHDRQAESQAARARRESRERRDREHEGRIIDDIVRVFDFRLERREEMRGRPAIVLAFAPRPGVTPLEDESAPMTKVRGQAWVDEQDHEVVRVDLECTDTITLGLGLLARIGKGTTLRFERQKVNGEAWLPYRVFMHPRARIAVFKRLDAEIVNEFSDYRKVDAETALKYGVAGASR